MRSMKVRIALAMGVIVLLAAPGALAAELSAAKTLPKLLTASAPFSRKNFKVKPASIAYTMGAFLGGPRRSGHRYDPLSWKAWTSSTAKGSGFDWTNTCKPDCASGTYVSYPVKLKAWRPRLVRGETTFTRLTVTFTAKRPPHTSQRTQVWKVKHNKGYYYWAYPIAH